jgi:hypothetical protein
MPDRLRLVTLVLGSTAALLLGTGALAATNPVTKSCPVAGLHFSEKQQGVTYAVAVANLKAKAATCPQARSLATTVAKDILHETNVPAQVAGLKVTIKPPCPSCTPNTEVTAKSAQKLITFTVKGGV